MAIKLLLDLPNEILDLILEHVICFRRKAPSTIEEASTTRYIGKIKQTDENGMLLSGLLRGKSRIRYETSGMADASLPLLLVNKYIHYRTKAILRYSFPHGPDYSLDALYVNETQLWPTWLRIPMQSRRVNSVELMLRVGGHGNPDSNLYIRGDGAPPRDVYMWFGLLNDFLCYGTKTPGQSETPQITVCNVNIRVTGADPDIMKRDSSKLARHRFMIQEISHRGFDAEAEIEDRIALHPKWLASFLSGLVSSMCTVSYHIAPYSMLMLERVKKVRVTYITIDGSEELVSEVNLGQKLREMWHDGQGGRIWENRSILGYLPSACRVLTFWNWKLRTLRIRQSYFDEPDPKTARWPGLKLWKKWKTESKEYREIEEDQGRLSSCDEQRCLCADESLTYFLQELHDSSLHHQDLGDQSST